MATRAVEQALLALEKKYWQAIKDKDADAAMGLSDDQCIITGAQGVGRIDKQTLARMMTAAAYTLQDFKIGDDAQVRLLGNDVAVPGLQRPRRVDRGRQAREHRRGGRLDLGTSRWSLALCAPFGIAQGRSVWPRSELRQAGYAVGIALTRGGRSITSAVVPPASSVP
jgi:Domain of unknown function (DUF4440)